MTTRLTDLQIPDNWMLYIQLRTEEKSSLIESGVIVRDTMLDERLRGGGALIGNKPHYRDLANEEENVSSDDPTVEAAPKGITTGIELWVRLSRNQSWSSMDLNRALVGNDPMQAIAVLTSGYWRRRSQAALIATARGVFANNALAAPGGGATQNDLTVDIAGAVFAEGVTSFSAEAFVDATHTMGDAQEDLGLMFVHSTVHARLLKNDLIDFMPDSQGRMVIPTFHGRRVVPDDGMPSPEVGVYETWIFGPGAFAWGAGQPKVPVETRREPLQGNGGGRDILVQRIEWVIHPNGHAYVGTPAGEGGPTNAATVNNLANEDSWQRRVAERKQIKMARLITREF